MKERIVIVEKELTNFLLKHKDNHEICAFSPAVIMRKSKVEQVPETFSELKTLCKKIKTDLKIFYFGDAIKIENKNFIVRLEDTGIIYVNASILINDRTPAQMWQIIKGLIGE